MVSKVFKKNIIIIILIIMFISFCLIARVYLKDMIISLDSSVSSLIKSINLKPLTVILKIITNLASTVGVITIFILSLFLFKDKIERIVISLDFCFIGIMVFLLKNVFLRTRPVFALIKVPSSYSFPSGHTFFSFGLYGLFVYFILRSNLHKKYKIILSSIVCILIVLISFSRVYLGVHHFTDVVGGLILGVLTLLMSINTYTTLKENK